MLNEKQFFLPKMHIGKKLKGNSLDRIKTYLYSSKRKVVRLTIHEKKLLERWTQAWHLLSGHNPQKSVANYLQRVYSISKATAYDDIKKSFILFDVQNIACRRKLLSAWIELAIEKLWERREEGGLELLASYFSIYAKINGLEKPEDSRNELIKKQLKQTTIIFTADNEALKKQINDLEKQTKN